MTDINVNIESGNQYNRLKELYDQKQKFFKKIKDIESEIDLIQKNNIKKCEHIWIREREPGQYGELWTFCKKCRVDKNNYNWIH